MEGLSIDGVKMARDPTAPDDQISARKWAPVEAADTKLWDTGWSL
jgi:hypothetical protein